MARTKATGRASLRHARTITKNQPRPTTTDTTTLLRRRRRKNTELQLGLYLVREVKTCRLQRNGLWEYLISWEGYDASADSWEPETNLAPAVLLQYWKDQLARAPQNVFPFAETIDRKYDQICILCHQASVPGVDSMRAVERHVQRFQSTWHNYTELFRPSPRMAKHWKELRAVVFQDERAIVPRHHGPDLRIKHLRAHELSRGIISSLLDIPPEEIAMLDPPFAGSSGRRYRLELPLMDGYLESHKFKSEPWWHLELVDIQQNKAVAGAFVHAQTVRVWANIVGGPSLDVVTSLDSELKPATH